ncbi:protein of unknown function [Magnetospira sp. QH-2]|nr:protein of unknown function [Magnetospira sp. QH-2]
MPFWPSIKKYGTQAFDQSVTRLNPTFTPPYTLNQYMVIQPYGATGHTAELFRPFPRHGHFAAHS